MSRRLRYKALKYVLLDNQLYHRTVNGVLLKCLNQEEAKVLMGEIHKIVCGAHCWVFLTSLLKVDLVF